MPQRPGAVGTVRASLETVFLGSGSSLLAALLGASAAAAAAAQPIVVAVEFAAPPGCSSVEAFDRGVQARTSRVRFSPGPERLRLQVRVTKSASNGRVRGELRVIDEGGQTDKREVEGATCAEVVEVLALTASLALDRLSDSNRGPNGSDAAGGPTEGTGSGGSTAASADPNASSATRAAPVGAAQLPGAGSNGQKGPPGAVATPELDSPVAPHAGLPRSSLRWSAGARLALAALLRGEASSGAELSLRGGWRASGLKPSFGVSLGYLTNRVLSTNSDLNAQWLAATLSGCPWSYEFTSGVALAPCALGTAGWLWVRHRTVESPQPSSRSWWSVGASLRFQLEFGGAGLVELEAGGSAPLVRRRFVIDPASEVGETATVVPLAALGLGYRF